jgi:hypothetical protein
MLSIWLLLPQMRRIDPYPRLMLAMQKDSMTDTVCSTDCYSLPPMLRNVGHRSSFATINLRELL